MAPNPLLTANFFQQIFPHEIISVADIEGGVSHAQLCRVAFKDRALVARKSAGYYGDEGWQTEMLISQYVADHGFAPPIRYYDQTLLLSLSDYVHDLGFYNFFRDDQQNAQGQMIRLIKSIHQILPKDFIKTKCVLNDFAMAINDIPPDFLDDKIVRILENALCTPWPTDRITFSHNDFQPTNILYDGESLFLIDWEMAGLSHPFYDVAHMGNYLFLDKLQGYELLSHYLDGEVTHDDTQIFDSLRRISYAFLAVINFQAAATHGDVVKRDQKFFIEENFADVFSFWRQSKKDKDLNKNYYLGLLFTLKSSAF